jgi:hypothetical protein
MLYTHVQWRYNLFSAMDTRLRLKRAVVYSTYILETRKETCRISKSCIGRIVHLWPLSDVLLVTRGGRNSKKEKNLTNN